jgi:hypothetical protein
MFIPASRIIVISGGANRLLPPGLFKLFSTKSFQPSKQIIDKRIKEYPLSAELEPGFSRMIVNYSFMQSLSLSKPCYGTILFFIGCFHGYVRKKGKKKKMRGCLIFIRNFFRASIGYTSSGRMIDIKAAATLTR